MSLVDVGAGLLNAIAGGGAHRIERGVPYGPHDRQRLDIYHPQARRPHVPALVFFYGGAWVKGSREMYGFVGHTLARRGFLTVIPDYRLRGQGGSSLSDAALAAALLAETEGDIVLLGHSAGAQLAAALAFSGLWRLVQPVVRGFIGMAGPYSYVPALGHAPMPPALLQVAGHDRLIGASEAPRFAEALKARGGTVDIRTYPRASHATLVGALSPPLRGVGPVLRDVEDFVTGLSRAA